jgi:hypothetical protein
MVLVAIVNPAWDLLGLASEKWRVPDEARGTP